MSLLFSPISKNLAFRVQSFLSSLQQVFVVTLINFIGRCLHSKVIPKGFRSNFHSSSLSHSNQYIRQSQCVHSWCAQNSLSLSIMSISNRAMRQEGDDINKRILHCRSEPYLKSVQLFQYSLLAPKFWRSILKFLTIYAKLRPKNLNN